MLNNGRCAALTALYEMTLPHNPRTRPFPLKRLGPVVGRMLSCYSLDIHVRLDEETFGLARVPSEEVKDIELNNDRGEEIDDFEEDWDDTKRFDEAEWNKQKQYSPLVQIPNVAILWDEMKARSNIEKYLDTYFKAFVDIGDCTSSVVHRTGILFEHTAQPTVWVWFDPEL